MASTEQRPWLNASYSPDPKTQPGAYIEKMDISGGDLSSVEAKQISWSRRAWRVELRWSAVRPHPRKSQQETGRLAGGRQRGLTTHVIDGHATVRRSGREFGKLECTTGWGMN